MVYVRVASRDRDDQRRGIAAQREACQHEAERIGAVITDEFVDAGASGNTTDRNGLQRLLTWVREWPVKYVIVRDRARLARNLADDVAINAEFKRAGVTVVSVSSDGDGGWL